MRESRDVGRLYQAPRRPALPRDAHERVVKPGALRAGGADRQEQRERVEGRFLDLDVVALEEVLLQVLDRIAAAGDVDRHLGRIEADAVVPDLRGQEVVELQNAERLGGIDERA